MDVVRTVGDPGRDDEVVGVAMAVGVALYITLVKLPLNTSGNRSFSNAVVEGMSSSTELI